MHIVDPDYEWVVGRYIEQNPVRARIVVRPEEYHYSSAKAHLKGIQDQVLTIDITEGKTDEYKAFFNDGEGNDVVDKIRANIQQGKPLGHKSFIEKLEDKFKTVGVTPFSPYDPEAGRFISADPLTWAPNDPRPRGYVRQGPFNMLRRANMDSGIDSLMRDMVYSNIIRGAINNIGTFNPLRFHLYTYCGNNPVNWLDPTGLLWGNKHWENHESVAKEKGSHLFN